LVNAEKERRDLHQWRRQASLAIATIRVESTL
jgi:hypothetical protein